MATFTIDLLTGDPYLFSFNASGGTSTGGTSNGLQQVTEINAITTIPSTFSGGLITSNFSPSSDSTTAIQFTDAGAAPIINIDTVSGFTGFQTTAPQGLIHAYGTDNSNPDDSWGLQSNSIIIDGDADVDKDIVWMSEGVPKWDAQIYRDEGGEFWYLYNPEAELNVLTVAESGKLGVNARTDIMYEHAYTISGATTHSFDVGGIYNKNFISVYEIRVDNVSTTPNTYSWRSSNDLGLTYSVWSSSEDITTTEFEIDSGISIEFLNATGFTLNDTWGFRAFPQLPSANFVVAANKLNETFLTDNYNAGTILYKDIAGSINADNSNNPIEFLKAGTTDGAIYWYCIKNEFNIF